ncbi:MAG: hypothetical protein JXB88_15610 [Spirochaetales bacterium]|nr:hypothetical protein [Spirochaetales bacterium]
MLKKGLLILISLLLFNMISCMNNNERLTEDEEWGRSIYDYSDDDTYKGRNPVDKMEKKLVELKIDYGVFDNHGERFKAAVVISGQYFEFADAFRSILNGLSTIGWARDMVLSEIKTTRELVEFTNNNKFSDYIEFPEELFFDLKWGDNVSGMKSALINSANDKKINLIISFGGIASGIFADLKTYAIPVLVDAVTDPVAAGIVPNVKDSGKDFLTCRMAPEQFRRQVRLFYDVVKFKKLGIIYGNNESGLVYGAVADVEAVAKEKGFEIVRNTNVIEDPSPDKIDVCIKMYLAALEELCPKVDALYLGASAGITEGDVSDIVKVINKHKKPAFALEGSIRVKEGILFGISMSGQVRAGIYNAKKIVTIFHGELPRNLPQLFENVPSVAINLKTAQIIEYDIPIEIIASSDEVYIDF